MKSNVEPIIRAGFAEDFADVGDVTTLATIPDTCVCHGTLLAKSPGVVAGFEPFQTVFDMLDKRVECRWNVEEGARVTAGTVVAHISGPARAGERLALNLIQRMSGIATKTRLMVDAIETTGSRTVLLDTRKTAPGLRALDKAAVVIGGGRNHRHGLYDAVLIKDNHIAVAGGIAAAFDRVQRYLKETRRPMEIVIEAQTLAEVDEVLALDDGVTRILLDNMIRIDNGVVNTTMLEAAIAHIGDRIPTEASGNITQATVGAVARTGVDFISSGELTHSVVAMDLSLKIVIDQ